MSYKTVLVHVDQGKDAGARIDLAAQIALAEGGHLIGAAMTGLSTYAFVATGLSPSAPPLQVPFDLLREEAGRALDGFEARMAALGVDSYERRLVDEEAGLGMSMQARYCDLVVLSQSDRDNPAPGLRADFPEYVLLNGGRPVLIVPANTTVGAIGRKILVAWNGSIEATRAIASALGMLRRASQVDVVVLNPEIEGDLHGEVPGADIALYLARHNIRVDTRSLSGVADVGEALLSLAADAGSDLLVMGGYGRSRLREILLGGATRTVLASARLPVWMAH